mgnify:CR=1 FL=1
MNLFPRGDVARSLVGPRIVLYFFHNIFSYSVLFPPAHQVFAHFLARRASEVRGATAGWRRALSRHRAVIA